MVPLALSTVVVRWLHVAGVAVLFGGATLTWVVYWYRPDAAPGVGRAYEWLFWGAAGVVVAAGVGNLGALAPAVPGGGWGATLALKLPLVAALLVLSLARTLLLVDGRGTNAGANSDVSSPHVALTRAYAATTLLLALLVALGEVLAHG